MKHTFLFLFALFIVFVSGMAFWITSSSHSYPGQIQNFDDCARAGYPIMESNPRQCSTPDGQWFAEGAVTEICRYQQDCGQGFYCRHGLCTELIVDNDCESNDDCQLMNSGLGFGCCWAGACEQIDYSEDKWIAINKNWLADMKKNYCPSIEECGPAPMCPVQSKNENYEAQCVKVQCITTPCPPLCQKVPLSV